MKTLREIYFEAADLIDQHGLARGKWRDDAGRLCMGGAVLIAAFENLITAMMSSNRIEVLRPLSTLSLYFTDFNDLPYTTAADVSAKLRELAASLPDEPARQTDISPFTEILDRENKKQRVPISLLHASERRSAA